MNADAIAAMAAAIRQHLGHRLCWPQEQKKCDAGERRCLCKSAANDIIHSLYLRDWELAQRLRVEGAVNAGERPPP